MEGDKDSKSMVHILTYLEDSKVIKFCLIGKIGGENPIDRLRILSRLLALLDIFIIFYAIYEFMYD